MVGTVKMYLSGGASNSVEADSIGGVKSSVRISSQDVAYTSTTIAGVVITDGFFNDAGTGELKIDADAAGGPFLYYKAPGETVFGEALSTSGTDGKLSTIKSSTTAPGGALLGVTITEASLPVSGISTVGITVTGVDNSLFPGITKAESVSGITRYRAIFIENESDQILSIAVTVPKNSSARDSIAVGWAVEAVDLPIEALADENTTPTGVTFTVSPDHNDDTMVKAIGIGEYAGLWIKNSTPPLSAVSASATDIDIRFKLSV